MCVLSKSRDEVVIFISPQVKICPQGRGHVSVRGRGSRQLKNMHVAVGAFRKIIQTLHVCNMIEEEFISAKMTSYTLKEVA